MSPAQPETQHQLEDTKLLFLGASPGAKPCWEMLCQGRISITSGMPAQGARQQD